MDFRSVTDVASRKELWALVERARRDPDAVLSRLADMSETELVDLYWTYQHVVADLKDESITAHLDPPPSEDGLDDLAHWVVGQGLDYYEDVMTEDGALPPRLPRGESVPFWDGEISKVYYERYGVPVRFQHDPPPAAAR